MVAEEKAIDGISFNAWHRVSLAILIKARGRTEMRPVSQAQLDQALALDRAPGPDCGEAARRRHFRWRTTHER